MGCRCCRMIKSYIYDPSVAVDVRKTDSAGNSLYQPHLPPGVAHGADPSHQKQKQGFNNLGYSKSNDSTLRLEVDNNHINHKLNSTKEQHRQSSTLPGEAALYIIQPDQVKPRWVVQEPAPVPVYPQKYRTSPEEVRQRASSKEWDAPVNTKSLSVDEIDEGVGGTPEYPCDTGDEGSVLSVDIHTSSTSLSSADTKDEPPKTPDVSTLESGICMGKSEDEEEEQPRKEEEREELEEEEIQSVTDSMVAEALAALEEATAGEEFE